MIRARFRQPSPSMALTGALLLLLGGCVSTVASVVTAPVRVIGKTADVLTTSQSEADEKRGRALRRQEEELGRLDRSYRRHLRQCDDGKAAACEAARDDHARIEALRASMAYPPR